MDLRSLQPFKGGRRCSCIGSSWIPWYIWMQPLWSCEFMYVGNFGSLRADLVTDYHGTEGSDWLLQPFSVLTSINSKQKCFWSCLLRGQVLIKKNKDIFRLAWRDFCFPSSDVSDLFTEPKQPPVLCVPQCQMWSVLWQHLSGPTLLCICLHIHLNVIIKNIYGIIFCQLAFCSS